MLLGESFPSSVIYPSQRSPQWWNSLTMSWTNSFINASFFRELLCTRNLWSDLKKGKAVSTEKHLKYNANQISTSFPSSASLLALKFFLLAKSQSWKNHTVVKKRYLSLWKVCEQQHIRMVLVSSLTILNLGGGNFQKNGSCMSFRKENPGQLWNGRWYLIQLPSPPTIVCKEIKCGWKGLNLGICM